MQSNINHLLDVMSPEEYAWVVGLETDDPLCSAFAGKRVLHAGLKGDKIPQDQWHATWNRLMGSEGSPGKRVAYIHIPFCSHKCLYCGFFQNYSAEEAETAYIDRLIKDLQMNHTTPYTVSGAMNSVYIGGGTPSALSPHNAARLLQAVRAYLPLANDYELTLEARIHDLIPDKMEVWLANGVNRVSIGVQSFHTGVRRAVGRLDDTETVLERLKLLSDYNQAAVIIDLMYGLPYQTMDVWMDDIALLQTTAIDGFDLYQLNVYENSALQATIDSGRMPAAATVAEQARMFAKAEAWLDDHLFTRISVCHWAKSNRERNMYNTLTKNGVAVVPFGSGAGGKIENVTLSLDRDLKNYMNAIDQGIKPIIGMLQTANSHGLQNDVLGQIKQGYLDIHFLAARYGENILHIKPLLDIWESRGLIRTQATISRLTVAGQFWYTNIAQSVLECLHALFNGEQLRVRRAFQG